MRFEDVITGTGIRKRFHKFELNIEELHIPKGFATALVGENGAGKSTLLNILSGIRLDAHGQLRYFGEDGGMKRQEIKERIGYTGTKNYYLPGWSGRQIRELYSLLFENFDAGLFDQICKDLAIDQDLFTGAGKPVSKLSDGNQVKLMLAGVFARQTDLLLLDEPASPLDPLMRDTLTDMLRKYVADGDGRRSVLFSTHNISDMENVTDYCMIMQNGQIVEQGFVEELREKYILLKGDAEYTEAARPYLVAQTKGRYGFEGVALSSKLDRFAGMKVEAETPTLFQISVAVMKQGSALKTPLL